jgi:hypothetical protein
VVSDVRRKSPNGLATCVPCAFLRTFVNGIETDTGVQPQQGKLSCVFSMYDAQITNLRQLYFYNLAFCITVFLYYFHVVGDWLAELYELEILHLGG